MTEVHVTTDRSRTSVVQDPPRQPHASNDAVTAMLTASPPARPVSASPDLVALVEEWQRIEDDVEGHPERTDEEVEPSLNRSTDLQMQIYRFPARSVADLLAKVPVFKDELQDAISGLSNGHAAEDTLAGAAWLGLFRDFERLDNGGREGPVEHDAELHALVDKWRTLSKAYDEAAKHSDDLSAVGHPEPPEAIFWRESDWDLGLNTICVDRADGRRWFFPYDSVHQHLCPLRQPQTRIGHGPPPPGSEFEGKFKTITQKLPWPERQERVNEIVSAFDSWRAEIKAAEVASGYASANAEAQRMGAELLALEEQIKNYTSTSLPGLARFVEFAKHLLDLDDDEPGLVAALIRNVESVIEASSATKLSHAAILDGSDAALLAAIETHKASHQALCDASTADDVVAVADAGGDSSDEAMEPARAAWELANEVELQDWRQLFQHRPRSLPGLIAVLRHLRQHYLAHLGISDEPAVLDYLVESACGLRVNEAMAIGADTDPIIAAIEKDRALAAEHIRLLGISGSKPDDDPSWEPTHDAHDAQWKHWDEVLLKTVPLTPAGCAALAAYADEWVEREGLDLDEAGSAILDLIAGSPALKTASTAAVEDDDEPFTAEKAAALQFDAFALDTPLGSPQDWLGHLSQHALAMHLGDRVPRMSKADAVAFIEEALQADHDTGDALFKMLRCAKEKFDDYSKLIAVAETRLLVAASTVAVSTAEPDQEAQAPAAPAEPAEPVLGYVPRAPETHPDAYGLRVDEHGAGLRAPPGSTVMVEPVRPTKHGLAVFYRKGRGAEIWDITDSFRPEMLDRAAGSELVPMIEVCDPVSGRRGFMDGTTIEKVHRVHGVYVPEDIMQEFGPLPTDLPTLECVPDGMGEHRVKDAAAYPLVRPGETVIFDPAQRDLETGSLCVLEWRGGGRSVLQTNQRTLGGIEGAWWVDPVNRPRTQAMADRALAKSGKGPVPILYASDGPYKADLLAEKILGKVVGILRRPRRAGDRA